MAQEAAIFAGREANGVEIESEEINTETQHRALDLLHYHDVRHDCSKHSVIIMEADGSVFLAFDFSGFFFFCFFV